ncbi:FAD-dependent oxidoreductase [Nonomuraea sp. NPDC046802]|uniref:NAD(P)/FAD-dependent oxidoreductase n=1 Tax=Nonomuraea sp. NPDC046802 TaxID=3154919 RepID=UPI0033CAB6C0
MRRIVIVGASLAAVNAVERLRARGYPGEIVLVGAEPELPYDRTPLSKQALHDGPDTAALLLHPPAWYTEHGVELRLGRAAVGLDLRTRQVHLAGGQTIAYEGLVIATGSRARVIAGARTAGALRYLRTIDDSTSIHRRLIPGRHLVVIGAGFIGLEVAATARQLGLDVTVVEHAPAPLTRVLGERAGNWFASYHRARGVNVRCGVKLARVDPVPAGSSTVRLSDGTALAADLIVAGVGASPATEWLRTSPLSLMDGVLCDSSLRASAPGVVAAGDACRWHNPRYGELMRVEQWSNAAEQGRHAADTLLTGVDNPYAPIPYFWSDQFEAKIRFVGRAKLGDNIHIQEDNGSMVALFGRNGLLNGALCVNAPRKLATYRQAILDETPWGDVI